MVWLTDSMVAIIFVLAASTTTAVVPRTATLPHCPAGKVESGVPANDWERIAGQGVKWLRPDVLVDDGPQFFIQCSSFADFPEMEHIWCSTSEVRKLKKEETTNKTRPANSTQNGEQGQEEQAQIEIHGQQQDEQHEVAEEAQHRQERGKAKTGKNKKNTKSKAHTNNNKKNRSKTPATVRYTKKTETPAANDATGGNLRSHIYTHSHSSKMDVERNCC